MMGERMGLTIRDEFMSLLQKEMALIERPVLVGCMDRRLTALFASAYVEGWEVIRTPGGFLNESEDVVREALKGHDTFIVTSHTTCGAAGEVEKVSREKERMPPDEYKAYKVMVDPFAARGCCSHEAVEKMSPELQKEFIEGVARKCGYSGKRIIVMPTIETAVTAKPERPGLIITSPLGFEYSKLQGVDLADDTKYYLHDRLTLSSGSVRTGVRLAAEEIGVREIQVISQNGRENSEARDLVTALREDPYLQMLGVQVNAPRLVQETRIVGIPPQPGARNRTRGRP